MMWDMPMVANKNKNRVIEIGLLGCCGHKGANTVIRIAKGIVLVDRFKTIGQKGGLIERIPFKVGIGWRNGSLKGTMIAGRLDVRKKGRTGGREPDICLGKKIFIANTPYIDARRGKIVAGVHGQVRNVFEDALEIIEACIASQKIMLFVIVQSAQQGVLIERQRVTAGEFKELCIGNTGQNSKERAGG